MISLALAAVLAVQGAPSTLVLTRGAVVRNIPIWDVEDATLDATKPTVNSAGDMDLVGGPLRTILIRFGDLDRVIGPNQRVKGAVLVLNSASSDHARLQAIARVLVPWGAGPYQTLGGFDLPHPNAAADERGRNDDPIPPRGAATWRQSRAGEGGATWEQPGARGLRDAVAISNAHLIPAGSEVRIDGLADAVQAMADHPHENYGFALTFETAASFASSESDTGRPRLELEVEDAPEKKGPDLSVIAIEREGPDGKLPVDGQTATYTAHVKNVGDAPSQGFSTTWSLDGRPGATETGGKPLGPGEEVTIPYHLPYRADKTDHRFQTLALRIRPVGEDASPRNDALTVYPSGKAVEVILSRDAAAALAKGSNELGSHSPEDWVQQQVSAFNDVYLARSRFSFAPDGAKERVSVQRIIIGDPGSHATPPTDGSASLIFASAPSGPEPLDPTFLRGLGQAVGLADRTLSNVPPDRNEILSRGGLDRFPGLMGYGDTRFEGLSPGQIELPYEAYAAPIFDNPPIEPTGLLAATDVLQLNAVLGGPATAFPRTILVRARNQANLPLGGLTLDFFQTKDGRIAKDAAPTFSVTTDATGNALLPNRGPSPFGAADPAPGADVLFVRASLNGVTDGTWLKAWQAIDTSVRGGPGTRAIAIMDLHFALPGAILDAGTDLAVDRIVTDSGGSLPAKLAPLIDGSNDTEATLGSKPGDWVEIDLGRDRTIGEVDLIAEPDAFWDKFDVYAYATGQRVEEAQLWAKEVDENWTSQNRRDVLGPTRVSVPYRGAVVRFRYLRIVNRSGGAGRLAEIRVVPVKNP